MLFSFSAAFSSGSINSLIFDRFKKNNLISEYSDLSRKGFSLMTISGAIAAIIGGKLAEVDLMIPVFLDLVSILIISFLCIFLIKEERDLKKTVIKKRHHIIKIVKDSFSEFIVNRTLLYFTLLSAITMGIFRVFFVSYQPVLVNVEVNIEQIGYLFAMMGGIASISSYLSAKYDLNHRNQIFLLLPIMLVFLVSTWFYTRVDFFYVVLAIILHQILRGIFMPYSGYIMNTLIKSSDIRSTILSSYSLISTVVCSIFLLIIGELKNMFDWETTYFFWSGISFTLMFLFIILYLKSYNKSLK